MWSTGLESPCNSLHTWLALHGAFKTHTVAQTTKFSLTSFSLTSFICSCVRHKFTSFPLTSFICSCVRHKLTSFLDKEPCSKAGHANAFEPKENLFVCPAVKENLTSPFSSVVPLFKLMLERCRQEKFALPNTQANKACEGKLSGKDMFIVHTIKESYKGTCQGKRDRVIMIELIITRCVWLSL